ncbi:hypothetical protein A2U01_0045616, partial [Trifolium medium]|nr:hypothetical protein [Trifolium medium]
MGLGVTSTNNYLRVASSSRLFLSRSLVPIARATGGSDDYISTPFHLIGGEIVERWLWLESNLNLRLRPRSVMPEWWMNLTLQCR